MKAPAVRYHCRKIKGKGAKVEKEANKILRAQAKSLLKAGKKYEFAIDENKQETYTKKDDSYVVKSKARNGTTKFYIHATLYTIAHGKRVTISFVRIKKKMSRLSIVKNLFEVIEAEGYCIRRLYLDRGFYSVQIVQYLQSKRVNTIIAMPIRGKKSGLASRLHGKKSHWIYDHEAYTTIDGKKLSIEHKVAVLATYQKNKRGKKGVRWYAYVVIGKSISLDRIKKNYRGRFGIETSYRIKNQARGWTTSTLPEMHTLYYAVSFIIQTSHEPVFLSEPIYQPGFQIPIKLRFIFLPRGDCRHF
jgi:putative transposase